MESITPLDSVDAIIDELGGPTKAGDALGATKANVVHWRTRGFPADRQADILLACRARGLVVADDLFPAVEPLIRLGR